MDKCGKIENGLIDHCLPIILPSIIDEIYGESGREKEMVESHMIPTLNMEVKKRKGYELLNIICRFISVERVKYLVRYFEKFIF